MTDALPPLPSPARITAVQFCEDGTWFTAEQMQAYARTALLVNEQNLREELAALRASLGEPVAWQFRWTNPGNSTVRNDELEWKPLTPRGSESMERRVAEMRPYTYDEKPCYEVRALYAIKDTK